MLSVDTNILFHASSSRSPLQETAHGFLNSHSQDTEFCLCELVLIELYVLLRNPAVVEHLLSAAKAVEICMTYRENRRWRIVDHPGNQMPRIWRYAAQSGRGRRTIFDARLAYTLLHLGVDEFATRDLDHFKDFGFARVWDSLQSAAGIATG